MDSLVSVVIPTYNRANTLERAIRSVLEQSYSNLELIVVNDGSIDQTSEVMQRLKDKRVKYIRCEKTHGAAAARNYGIRLAKGHFIAFQDSDDEWVKDKLSIQLELLCDSSVDVGVVYSGFVLFDRGKKEYMSSRKPYNMEGNVFHYLLQKNFVSTPSVLVKKACIEKCGGFDESLPRYQDWEFFLRLSKHYKFKFINRPLVYVYMQDNSISKSKRGEMLALEIIIKKHYDDFLKDSRANLVNKIFWLGRTWYSNNEYQRGLKLFYDASIRYPLSFKNWAQLIIFTFHFKFFVKSSDKSLSGQSNLFNHED